MLTSSQWETVKTDVYNWRKSWCQSKWEMARDWRMHMHPYISAPLGPPQSGCTPTCCCGSCRLKWEKTANTKGVNAAGEEECLPPPYSSAPTLTDCFIVLSMPLEYLLERLIWSHCDTCLQDASVVSRQCENWKRTQYEDCSLCVPNTECYYLTTRPIYPHLTAKTWLLPA